MKARGECVPCPGENIKGYGVLEQAPQQLLYSVQFLTHAHGWDKDDDQTDLSSS